MNEVMTKKEWREDILGLIDINNKRMNNFFDAY